MTDKIKNCPFCNGEAQLMIDELDISSTEGTVMCMSCYATSNSYNNADDAVRQWNRRYTPSSVDTNSKRGGLGKSIKCIDTGRVYDSQRQACEDLGITPAALCNHLKGRTGYNTVGGLKFERIDTPSA